MKSLKKAIAKFKKICPDMGVGRGKGRASAFSISKFQEYTDAYKRKELNRDAALMSEQDFFAVLLKVNNHKIQKHYTT